MDDQIFQYDTNIYRANRDKAALEKKGYEVVQMDISDCLQINKQEIRLLVNIDGLEDFLQEYRKEPEREVFSRTKLYVHSCAKLAFEIGHLGYSLEYEKVRNNILSHCRAKHKTIEAQLFIDGI